MILFVCTGNTCRSPMAAVLAIKMLAEAGIDCAVQSAGVSASPECGASTHAIRVMDEEGCDLLSHRSQRVTDALLAEAKLVLTMTKGHRSAVLFSCPGVGDKVFTLYEYAGYGRDIGDPFGGDYNIYRACATQIKDLLQECIKKLKKGGI
ncbi:MAG: low molecular weight protein arginine phosphatase [Defluviitaleaceae bacterium]|nr:low molecular weight protein arginine phosphatase [Defluviitaleaceae bacterium]MCL2240205.1 low molecular weight protein arginine phosphatase [Defluviitaleaceae bacterium]